ncbi:unnamed protein product [Arctia plantaginis]|uniref:Uncharacterized protein n=1 Tax=Arctia plantaginis TaxID=874455 RepID=A0A8S1B2V6_ARCPL|nr:unnamed protein product [Arctia plantaginis]
MILHPRTPATHQRPSTFGFLFGMDFTDDRGGYVTDQRPQVNALNHPHTLFITKMSTNNQCHERWRLEFGVVEILDYLLNFIDNSLYIQSGIYIETKWHLNIQAQCDREARTFQRYRSMCV